MTAVKLVILVFITLVSFWYFSIENFDPFFVEGKGFDGVIESTTILFFGYLGFDFMTTVTEEATNPIRDVPKAILISVVLSMLIYTMVTFAVSGVGNLAAGRGDGETALAEIFEMRGASWMEFVIFFCAILGICSGTLTNLMSQSRNLYSYSKDGLFFKVFQELDPVSNVPVKGAWIVVVPIIMTVFSFDIVQLAQLCSLGNLMTYAFINTAVIALRLSHHSALSTASLAQ